MRRVIVVYASILLFAIMLAYAVSYGTQAVISTFSYGAKDYDVIIKNINGYAVVFDSYGNLLANTTNTTEAFLTAFNHLYSTVTPDIGSVKKGTILIDGKFWVNKTIPLNLTDIYLTIRGLDQSGFYTNNNITILEITKSVYGFSLENLIFDGITGGVYLLKINGSWGRVEKCYFGDAKGIFLQGSHHIIEDNSFEDVSNAIVVRGTPKDYSMYITIDNNIFTNVPSGTVGVVTLEFIPDQLKGVQYATITNNIFSTYASGGADTYIKIYGDVKDVVVSGNVFHNAVNGVWVNNYYTVVPGDIVVSGNSFYAITTYKVKSGGGINTAVWDNNDFRDVREQHGYASFTGDGSTTTFYIAHGLYVEPNYVSITPLSGTAMPDSISYNQTHIILEYSSAPANGTVLEFSWEVKR